MEGGSPRRRLAALGWRSPRIVLPEVYPALRDAPLGISRPQDAPARAARARAAPPAPPDPGATRPDRRELGPPAPPSRTSATPPRASLAASASHRHPAGPAPHPPGGHREF